MIKRLLIILSLILAGPAEVRASMWRIVYHGRHQQQPSATYTILDLFEFDREDVNNCHRPIAYFSAHWESWRPDAHRFHRAKKRRLGNWKGEYYVNWNRDDVKQVMRDRLRKAKEMGFWGVDIDNVDGPGGRDYFAWLYAESKKLGLKVGLKNFVEVLPLWGNQVDFFVIEATTPRELQMYELYKHKPMVRMKYGKTPTPRWMAEVRNGNNGNKF